MAGIIGDVAGKHAIIFDDEIATGGTIVELVRLLREQDVNQVTLACTHGVFSGPAVERLCGIPEIVEIVTTNTVPLPPEKHLPKLTVLSVAFIFAEAIRRNMLGQSVGSLFAYWPDEKALRALMSGYRLTSSPRVSGRAFLRSSIRTHRKTACLVARAGYWLGPKKHTPFFELVDAAGQAGLPHLPHDLQADRPLPR